MLCQVCEKEASKYCCPKCGVQYCNLDCYRSHSAGCTDAFYRSNVEEELRRTSATDESKHEMLEILKRVYQHDQEEEDDVETETESVDTESSSSRLLLSEKSIQLLWDKFFDKSRKKGGSGGEFNEEEEDDIDMAEVERLIPRSELDAFYRAALQGKLSHLVVSEDWQPWWCTREAAELKCGKDGTRLVKAVIVGEGGSTATSSGSISLSPSSNASSVPQLPTNSIPPLSAITRTRPSKDLPWHMVDVIYSYCFVHRMWEGQWRDLKESGAQAAEEMCTISNVLTMAANAVATHTKKHKKEKKKNAKSVDADAGSVASPNATARARCNVASSSSTPATVLSIGSARQAIFGCIENVVIRSTKTLGLNYTSSSSQREKVVSDVATILGCGKACVLCALEDARSLMACAAANCKKKDEEKDNNGNPKRPRLLFKSLGHKLSFFLAWVNEQPEEMLVSLGRATQLVETQLEEDSHHSKDAQPNNKNNSVDEDRVLPWEVAQGQQIEQKKKAAAGSAPLIEEID